ncbi:MAG: bis(5'-nucleosyl)-tetraphosphatase (symmetrical) YqeK [Candidatus Sumerlaeota bacterium]|nr:bis(5'-nucleosyl)-tetraphosphatase (symmetrical) YqeK [Candidatus Sumerlaeota bacterium]
MLEKDLGARRFHHSLGAGELAVVLASANGTDADRAYTAALLHDCAKALSADEIMALAQSGQYPVDAGDFEFPGILHAPVGAMLARSRHGIGDDEILEAIACHPTGRAGAPRLLWIVMAADYCEPTRDFPGSDDIRRLVLKDLRKGLLMVLKSKIQHLTGLGKPAHPRVCSMIAELERTPERVGTDERRT